MPKPYSSPQRGLNSSHQAYAGYQAQPSAQPSQQYAGNGQHHGLQYGLAQRPVQDQYAAAVQPGYISQAAQNHSEVQPYTSPLKQVVEGRTPSGLPTWGSTGIRASHAAAHHSRGGR